MAKGKKSKKKKDETKSNKKSPSTQKSPLQPALDTFDGGDYVRAKAMFEEKIHDPELSDENRHVAKALLESIGLDRGTLLVGAACIGLYLLVILVGYLKQP